MQDLTASVLAGFGSALVLVVAYHFLVAAPRSRSVRTMLGTHDGLLGGGGADPASQRMASLEAAAGVRERELAQQSSRIAALEKVAQSETYVWHYAPLLLLSGPVAYAILRYGFHLKPTPESSLEP